MNKPYVNNVTETCLSKPWSNTSTVGKIDFPLLIADACDISHISTFATVQVPGGTISPVFPLFSTATYLAHNPSLSLAKQKQGDLQIIYLFFVHDRRLPAYDSTLGCTWQRPVWVCEDDHLLEYPCESRRYTVSLLHDRPRKGVRSTARNNTSKMPLAYHTAFLN